jgi:hypothetical protein
VITIANRQRNWVINPASHPGTCSGRDDLETALAPTNKMPRLRRVLAESGIFGAVFIARKRSLPISIAKNVDGNGFPASLESLCRSNI